MRAPWILAVLVMIVALVAMIDWGRGGSSADDTVDGSNPSLSQSVVTTTLDEDSQRRDSANTGESVRQAPVSTALSSPTGVTRPPFLAVPPPVIAESPPPEPAETAQEPADAPYRLTEAEFISLARTVGMTREWAIDGLFRIACGYPPHSFGESACRLDVPDNGPHIGILQINPGFWADTCGLSDDGRELRYPAPSIACARNIIAAGERLHGDPWHYWSARP